MKTVRPDQPEPIPVRAGSHRMGSIIIRFVVLLAIVAGVDAARMAALEGIALAQGKAKAAVKSRGSNRNRNQ